MRFVPGCSHWSRPVNGEGSLSCSHSSEGVHLVAGWSDIGDSMGRLCLRHRQRIEGIAQQLNLTSLVLAVNDHDANVVAVLMSIGIVKVANYVARPYLESGSSRRFSLIARRSNSPYR